MTTFGGFEQPAGGAQSPPTAPAPRRAPSPGFDWVRTQGIRRARDRWLGGVASGIAHRMGVPPFVVRAVFAGLTLFSGLGLFAYGVAWALLPGEDDLIHAEEVGHGHWSAGMTGAVIMTLLGLSDAGMNPVTATWGFWWFLWPVVWVAAVAAVVYLIMSRERSGASGSSRSQPHPPAVLRSMESPGRGTGIPAESGPLFAAPPSRIGPGSPPHIRTRQPRPDHPEKPLVAVVTGTAVIVASVALFLGSAGTADVSRQAVAVAWAAAAAVLGLGIVVAGLAGRSSGILGFLAVAALVSAALTSLFTAPGNVAVGRISNWAPESTSGLADGYSIAAGTGKLDLSSVAASGPLPADITVPVNLAASTVAIQIPSDIPVQVNSRMAFGTVQYQDGVSSTGIWNPEEHTYNPGAPGGTLVLDLQGAFSTVNISGPS